ncbi:MAG TPA: hypothetical protein VNN79_13240, partial [Actinomycetota bacterium]|nr:hypothetical protein [Actinomycetota bacterium]
SQPGAPTVFPTPPAPIYNYQGPYHFKPPFSIGGGPGAAVMPPQGSAGGIHAPAGSNLGGGHAVVPPGGTAATGSDGSAQPTVRVGAASAGDPGSAHGPSLLWLLAPLGLVIVVAMIGAVVFEPDERPAASPQNGQTASEVTDTPPAGPFAALGFAVRRLVRRRRGS